jgi:hypothetical protein
MSLLFYLVLTLLFRSVMVLYIILEKIQFHIICKKINKNVQIKCISIIIRIFFIKENSNKINKNKNKNIIYNITEKKKKNIKRVAKSKVILEPIAQDRCMQVRGWLVRQGMSIDLVSLFA